MTHETLTPLSRARWCLAAMALAALSACGGGGSGTDAAITKPEASLDTANNAPAPTGTATTSTTATTPATTPATSTTTSTAAPATSPTPAATSPSAPAVATATPAQAASAPAPTAAAPTPAPAPAAPALEFTVGGDLADSTSLPSPTSEVTDTLVHSPTAGAEFAHGLFRFGKARVTGDAECGTAACLYFDRVRQDATGRITTDSWAYKPASKAWVPLLGGIFLTDGMSFTETNAGDGLWTNGYSIETQAAALAEGQWRYSRGQVSHTLFASETSLAGRAMSNVLMPASYPADAKTVDLRLVQSAGMLVAVDGPSVWGKADDASVYTSLAAFRAAHTSSSTPYCLQGVGDSRSGLVFDPSTQQAAKMNLSTSSFCALATVPGSQRYLAQSVATVGGRKVMLFPATAADMAGATGRTAQKLLAVTLNTAGKPASGWAYLPGQTHATTGLYNRGALQAWLGANTSDSQALTLP